MLDTCPKENPVKRATASIQAVAPAPKGIAFNVSPSLPPFYQSKVVTELGEIRVELRSHDARLTANHDSIGNLRERTAGHDTKIQVLMTELREGREDIGEMRDQLSGVSKSFYIAAAAMAGLMVSVMGLIATLLAH